MLPSCGGKAPLPGELSPKVTERLLHICGDLSVSASPSHLPWEGRPWGTHSKASPMRGSCRQRRLMRWTVPRRRKCPHLIRHGLRRATFPYEGKALVLKNRKSSRKKVQPDKFRLHLLFTADILRQLLTNLMYRIRRRVPRRP